MNVPDRYGSVDGGNRLKFALSVLDFLFLVYFPIIE